MPQHGEDHMKDKQKLPLHGVRVVECAHMVMGPTCGLILADFGASVIKIEPITGDSTRNLRGSGAGFFPAFNRNKRSLAVDLKDPRGQEIVLKMAAVSDVFSENFKNGALEKLGLHYEALSRINERLIYVSHKGFLPGPYEHRTALDEVVQMMGGLAYMTGPEGQPLRAGASVNDIMGGMFGALGVFAALRTRDETGKGHEVIASLYENNIFLVGTHMLQYELTGRPASPMPNRVSAWGIYDVFSVRDGEQIFLGVVSDTQWKQFCTRFQFDDLGDDARLRTNNDRVKAREWLMPMLRTRLADKSAAEIAAAFDESGLPYALIKKPHELHNDPHLLATGGLAKSRLPDEREVHVPLLPLVMNGERLPLRNDPPAVGQQTDEVLIDLGYRNDDIAALRNAGVVA
jgi:crotonobetainyl-CoA:carnitine CoA-transferase CaiB-like acyl-CoA transferase